MTSVLTQYIRKGQKQRLNKKTKKMEVVSRGRPVGIMIACTMEDSGEGIIGIAFSRFHLKKEPFWSEETGNGIAFERATKYFFSNYPPKFVIKQHPKYVRRQFLKFAERTQKYFKNQILPPWFKYYKDTDLFYIKTGIRHNSKNFTPIIEEL